jgi:hypothetical protein
VLINVCETIAHCKSNNIKGSVLAIDMAKAFDTLDHNFIKAVYRFFGFGENIISWLNLLGFQRQACIIMEDGSNSKYFDLETGRAQGDNLSPNIFNFCEQILILKLELCPTIAKIPRPLAIIENDVQQVYSAEAHRETCTNESLADDNTVLSLIDQPSLQSIKFILEKFAVISGLHCNFDKTALMPINPLSLQERTWIEDCGFKIVSSIKLLGADITTNIDDIQSNFIRIREKIINLISFWSRFKLSLPGRLSIAKTFLLSQLNYLGCVFKPDPGILTEIQNLINSFIRKNLKISDVRITTTVPKGGLGFFNLQCFLDTQRCTWLLRAKRECIDNWRYDLLTAAPNNDILLLRKDDIENASHPILYNFCHAFDEFYVKFCRDGDNYYHAQIYDNAVFSDPDSGSTLNKNFFGINFYNTHKDKIRKIKFSDCFTILGFKTLAQFRDMDLPFTMATWMRIRNALLHFRGGFREMPKKPSSIFDFVYNC